MWRQCVSATTPCTGCVTWLRRKRDSGRVSEYCRFFLTRCDSDEPNMSHTSIRAEGFKPAAGRSVLCNQKQIYSLCFQAHCHFYFFIFFLTGCQLKEFQTAKECASLFSLHWPYSGFCLFINSRNFVNKTIFKLNLPFRHIAFSLSQLLILTGYWKRHSSGACFRAFLSKF